VTLKKAAFFSIFTAKARARAEIQFSLAKDGLGRLVSTRNG